MVRSLIVSSKLKRPEEKEEPLKVHSKKSKLSVSQVHLKVFSSLSVMLGRGGFVIVTHTEPLSDMELQC